MRLRLKVWHRKQRYSIRQRPAMNSTYRVAVGVVGGLMVLAGLVMIPLPIPGPGWVTFFLGLGVLSTEFAWAHRITTFMRTMLRRAGQLTARATAYVADHVVAPVLLFVASTVYARRPVPVRVAARI